MKKGTNYDYNNISDHFHIKFDFKLLDHILALKNENKMKKLTFKTLHRKTSKQQSKSKVKHRLKNTI